MRSVKNIISLLLVLAIATSGIPCFLAEDASHDGTVDLQDAILQVQDFTGSTDDASFGFHFEKMLSTLSTVAGLKTLINPDKGSKSSKHQGSKVLSLDKIFQTYTIQLPAVLNSAEEHPEKVISYRSMTVDPAIPPPKIV